MNYVIHLPGPSVLNPQSSVLKLDASVPSVDGITMHSMDKLRRYSMLRGSAHQSDTGRSRLPRWACGCDRLRG